MMVTMAIGLFWMNGKDNGEWEQTRFGWIYTYTLVPLQGTMFSILAFFIASAAYRSFRARTPRGGGPAGRGGHRHDGARPARRVSACPDSGDVTQWMLNVLNSAVRRAILIGVSLGAWRCRSRLSAAMSDRTWVGERNSAK